MSALAIAEGILIACGVIIVLMFVCALFVRSLVIYKMSGFGFIGWVMRLVGKDE